MYSTAPGRDIFVHTLNAFLIFASTSSGPGWCHFNMLWIGFVSARWVAAQAYITKHGLHMNMSWMFKVSLKIIYTICRLCKRTCEYVPGIIDGDETLVNLYRGYFWGISESSNLAAELMQKQWYEAESWMRLLLCMHLYDIHIYIDALCT